MSKYNFLYLRTQYFSNVSLRIPKFHLEGHTLSLNAVAWSFFLCRAKQGTDQHPLRLVDAKHPLLCASLASCDTEDGQCLMRGLVTLRRHSSANLSSIICLWEIITSCRIQILVGQGWLQIFSAVFFPPY